MATTKRQSGVGIPKVEFEKHDIRESAWSGQTASFEMPFDKWNLTGGLTFMFSAEKILAKWNPVERCLKFERLEGCLNHHRSLMLVLRKTLCLWDDKMSFLHKNCWENSEKTRIEAINVLTGVSNVRTRDGSIQTHWTFNFFSPKPTTFQEPKISDFKSTCCRDKF